MSPVAVQLSSSGVPIRPLHRRQVFCGKARCLWSPLGVSAIHCSWRSRDCRGQPAAVPVYADAYTAKSIFAFELCPAVHKAAGKDSLLA